MNFTFSQKNEQHSSLEKKTLDINSLLPLGAAVEQSSLSKLGGGKKYSIN